MPTIYRNGDSVIKVTAPKEFTDRITNAESEAIAAARVAKMKLNLSSNEYHEAFREWERLKQESAQRLQRIEQQQLSHQRQRQPQNRKEAVVIPSRSSRTIVANKTENNSSNEVVIRNLKLMKQITGT
jgi:hypothetical protein